ncbi:MAG: hypothetical protein WKF36_04985 [Candidatus Nitrosocosmicus sp.]
MRRRRCNRWGRNHNDLKAASNRWVHSSSSYATLTDETQHQDGGQTTTDEGGERNRWGRSSSRWGRSSNRWGRSQYSNAH